MNTLKKQSITSPSTSSLAQIPYGYCHCGCGDKAPLSPKTVAKTGYKKGEPQKFINGHSSIKPRGISRTLNINGIVCRTIPLTKSREAIVYESDYLLVSSFRWRAWRKGDGRDDQYYAKRVDCSSRPRKVVAMHNMILPRPKGMETDHKNGNGLDNRRENLRVATHQQNGANRRKLRSKTSTFKGVYRIGNRWGSTVAGKRIGTFATEVDAAVAYDDNATEQFGEFAKLNFPRENIRELYS